MVLPFAGYHTGPGTPTGVGGTRLGREIGISMNYGFPLHEAWWVVHQFSSSAASFDKGKVRRNPAEVAGPGADMIELGCLENGGAALIAWAAWFICPSS